MNYTGRELHILKKISNNKIPTSINRIRREFMNPEIKINNLIDLFISDNAVTIGDENLVFITPEGSAYLKEFETNELALIRQTVFEKYDYALIQFFYNRKGIVYLEDIPEVLKREAPHRRNDGCSPGGLGGIHEAIFRLKSKVRKVNLTSFEITEDGKAYYENLIKEGVNLKRYNNLQTPIQITGNGNIVNTGHYATLFANVSVNPQLSQLKSSLKEIGVEDQALNDLESILASNPMLTSNKLPTSIYQWIGKLFGDFLEKEETTAHTKIIETLASIKQQY